MSEILHGEPIDRRTEVDEALRPFQRDCDRNRRDLAYFLHEFQIFHDFRECGVKTCKRHDSSRKETINRQTILFFALKAPIFAEFRVAFGNTYTFYGLGESYH